MNHWKGMMGEVFVTETKFCRYLYDSQDKKRKEEEEAITVLYQRNKYFI